MNMQQIIDHIGLLKLMQSKGGVNVQPSIDLLEYCMATIKSQNESLSTLLSEDVVEEIANEYVSWLHDNPSTPTIDGFSEYWYLNRQRYIPN